MGTEEIRNWMLRVNNKSHGPFTQNDVQKLLTVNKVSTTDFVSHPIVTNGSWIRLGNLRLFEQCEPRVIASGPPPISVSLKDTGKQGPLNESGTHNPNHLKFLDTFKNVETKQKARKNRSNALVLKLILGLVCIGIGSIATAILYTSVLTRERGIFQSQCSDLEAKLKTFDESVLLLRKQIAEEKRKRADVQSSLSGIDKTVVQEKDVQINALQSKIEQLVSDKTSMQKQLDELKNQNLPTPVAEPIGSMIAEVEKNVNLAAETIGLTNAKPKILKAASLPNISWGARVPYLYVEVGVVVENTTSKAISELTFHVQLKSRHRTVPVGEKIESLKIPGGIEPGEQKMLQVNVRGTDLGISGLDYKLRHLPAGTELFVAIVDLADFENGKELYEMFADIPHMAAPYTFVERRDPALKALGL